MTINGTKFYGMLISAANALDNKQEIINISRRIGTFETSIEPYEDCCTIFTPKHPRTKPILHFVEQAEREAELDELIEEAIQNTTVKTIDF